MSGRQIIVIVVVVIVLMLMGPVVAAHFAVGIADWVKTFFTNLS